MSSLVEFLRRNILVRVPRLPIIKIVDELPEWIINSESAAYCPIHNSEYPCTIWISTKFNNTKIEFVKALFHELVHWIIDVSTPFLSIHIKYNLQKLYDIIDCYFRGIKYKEIL